MSPRPTDYNINSSEEEILEACKGIDQLNWASSEAKNLYLSYLMGLLNLKQQKKLFDEQKRSSRNLVIATWALVIATLILVVTDKIWKIKN